MRKGGEFQGQNEGYMKSFKICTEVVEINHKFWFALPGLLPPKDGKEQKNYDVLEWLAAMGTHVSNRGAQSVRYYGHYSSRCQARPAGKGS